MSAAKKHNTMTLTPLHLAFVWIFKPKFRILQFAPLTIGAMIPDLEPLISWMFGVSVFCGWDFPCTLAPDRLVLHSIVGALTADVALTVLFVKIIGYLKPERLGIHGFTGARIGPAFLASAAIGSLSHVLIDWLHHPANPVFWPFTVNGSYYVDGLLLSFLNVFSASLILAVVSSVILVVIMKRILDESGHSFWLLFSNPAKALSLITKSLSK